MNRFVVPLVASIVIGLLLGAAAVLGGTLLIGSQTAVSHGESGGAAVLNRVEYGDRQ